MPLLNSVYLASLVLQEYIPLPRSKLWAQLNSSISNVVQEELRLCRSVWRISFFIALVAGFIIVYLLRFLQKYVEMPHKKLIFATSWLPRQLTVEHMKYKFAEVREDPHVATEKEIQIVELLVLLKLCECATSGDDFVLSKLAKLNAINRIANINDLYPFNFERGRQTNASAMMIACKMNHKNIVQLLLLHPNLDINLTETQYGRTALMLSCYLNHIDIVKILLKVPNIDYNHQAKPGWTALLGVCANSHVEVVKELLQMPGIDVNNFDDEGFTGLIWAVSNNHRSIVKMLLDHPDIDVNATTNFGVSAYRMAQIKGHKKVMEMLKNCGKSIDSVGGKASKFI